MVAKKGARMATAIDVVRINETLTGKVEPDGEGFVKYIPGWGDKQVADAVNEKFGSSISYSSVVTVRTQVHGKLRQGGSRVPAEVGKLQARVIQLEEACSIQTNRIAYLEEKVNFLLSELGVKT